VNAGTCPLGGFLRDPSGRHDATDQRCYTIGSDRDLVLVYPHASLKVGAVLSARRALELISERTPELIAHVIKEVRP
jgi:hypothetical protein